MGVVCAVGYAGFRAKAAERPPGFSARESIHALRERPILSRVALAQGFYGGGLIAALPLYALVYVDRLDLSLSDVGIIGILTSAATTVSFLAWGAVSDRKGPLVAMAFGSRARACWPCSPWPSPRASSCSGSRPWRPARRAPRSMSGSRPS